MSYPVSGRIQEIKKSPDYPLNIRPAASSLWTSFRREKKMPEIVYFSFLLSCCSCLLCPHSTAVTSPLKTFHVQAHKDFPIGWHTAWLAWRCSIFSYIVCTISLHTLFVNKIPLHYISYQISPINRSGDISASDSVHTLSVNKFPQHYIFPLIYFPIKSYPLTGPAMISDSDSFSYYQLTSILYTF